MPAPWHSHGTGRFDPRELGSLGERVVFEEGVLVFNPQFVYLGDDVYVGHRAMLKGDTRGRLEIGSRSWIGQDCYFQSAGGIRIGNDVGLGPRTMMMTSKRPDTPPGVPLMEAPLEFEPIEIGYGCVTGTGSIVLGGTRLGRCVLVGAGAVVSGAFPDDVVIAGVPARITRRRGERADAD